MHDKSVNPEVAKQLQDLAAVQNQANFNSTGYSGGGISAPPLPPSPCPHCGRCPTCGRGGYGTYPYYPSWPYQSYPWITYTISNSAGGY